MAGDQVCNSGEGLQMTDLGKLQAGPELDALVAEKVMGWSKPIVVEVDGRPVFFGDPRQEADGLSVSTTYRMRIEGLAPLPHFSADIAAAWEVARKMKIAVSPVLDERPEVVAWRAQVDDAWGYFEAPDAPLAICRAALKAVGQG
jgi:hypothetical protein